MKAITIWQPWASLLACGAKRFETRSWATSYRGPIAIHAAKRGVFSVLNSIHPAITQEMRELIGRQWNELPTGVVVATATLAGCHEIDHIKDSRRSIDEIGCWDCDLDGWIAATPQEVRFGDWTPGRYAWEFADMKPIEPIPAKGKQGLWEWKEEQ